MAHDRQSKEARDVCQRHVQHPRPRGDDQAKGPDHEIDAKVIAPLVTENRDAICRSQYHEGDGEIARVPEMPVAIDQHVLRRDRKKSAEREGPEDVGLRLGKQRQADSGDVRARDVHHTTSEPPRQKHLRGHTHTKRRHEPLVAAEYAVTRLAGHEHERDEEDYQVLRIDSDRAEAPHACICGGAGHCGSVITCSWSVVRPVSICSLPDGHRIVTRSTELSPRPKCRRRSPWLQNPLPPSTTWRWRTPPNSTVTSAPIALRLLRVPMSCNSTHLHLPP